MKHSKIPDIVPFYHSNGICSTAVSHFKGFFGGLFEHKLSNAFVTTETSALFLKTYSP